MASKELTGQASASAGLGVDLTRGALAGLSVGFLASFIDVLVASRFGRDSAVIPYLGQSMAVWIPLCWVGGAIAGMLIQVLNRVSMPIQRAVNAILPALWLLAVYIYLSISFFHGLSSFADSANCLLMTLLLGLPCYWLLRYFFVRLGKMSASGMLAVAFLVSLAIFIELGVWYLSL